MTTRTSRYSIFLTFNNEWLGFNARRARVMEEIGKDRPFRGVESHISAIVQRGYAHMVEEIAPFNDTTLRIRGEYIPSEEGSRTFNGLIRFLRLYGFIDIQDKVVLRNGSDLESLADSQDGF